VKILPAALYPLPAIGSDPPPPSRHYCRHVAALNFSKRPPASLVLSCASQLHTNPCPSSSASVPVVFRPATDTYQRHVLSQMNLTH
jgi:hypothetical protein